MRDAIVSVRLPKKLITELRAISEDQYYLDISEAIRSIVREKCLEQSAPYSLQLKKVVEDIEQQVALNEKKQSKQQVVSQLRRLLTDLENEQ